VRTKKAKRASVRYLLSGDRSLRRLTLRRLPSIRARTDSSRKTGRSKPIPSAQTTRRASSFAPRMLLFAAVFLTAGGALMAAKMMIEPTRPEVSSAAPVRQTTVSTPILEQSPAVVRPAPAAVSPDPAPKPRAVPPPASERVESAPRSAKRSEDSLPIVTAESNVAAVTAPSTAAVEADQPPPVTIVGCLEGNGDTFWLKNASGEGVPTARSWKTGFLKKHTPSMALVDTTQRLNLQGHVGQRVAVTGAVTDRAMRTHSLSLVASSCN